MTAHGNYSCLMFSKRVFERQKNQAFEKSVLIRIHIQWKGHMICSQTPCLRIQPSAPNQWQPGNSRCPAKQCVSRQSALCVSSVQPFRHSALNKAVRCDRLKEESLWNAERAWLMKGACCYLCLSFCFFWSNHVVQACSSVVIDFSHLEERTVTVDLQHCGCTEQTSR